MAHFLGLEARIVPPQGLVQASARSEIQFHDMATVEVVASLRPPPSGAVLASRAVTCLRASCHRSHPD